MAATAHRLPCVVVVDDSVAVRAADGRRRGHHHSTTTTATCSDASDAEAGRVMRRWFKRCRASVRAARAKPASQPLRPFSPSGRPLTQGRQQTRVPQRGPVHSLNSICHQITLRSSSGRPSRIRAGESGVRSRPCQSPVASFDAMPLPTAGACCMPWPEKPQATHRLGQPGTGPTRPLWSKVFIS